MTTQTLATAPDIRLSGDQKRLLGMLRIGEPLSRIVLARRLGINNGVVTRLTKELLSLGFISELDAHQTPGRGRPSLPLTLRREGAYAIGAAVHPGWVDIAVVDFLGAAIAQRSVTFEEGEPADFAALLDATATEMTATLPLRRSRFLGFGVGVPGFALGSSARRRTVARLKSWRGRDLSAELGAVLGAPVWIENDANAAALAEFYAASGQRPGGSMLVLYLGHGIGAGVIAGDALYEGEFCNAGEIGMLYPLDAPRPTALDLVRSVTGSEADPSMLRDLWRLDVDSDAIAAWAERAAGQLQLAVTSGIAWHDPAAIVLSGALPDKVLAMIRDHVVAQDWTRWLDDRPMPVVTASAMRGAAAAIGAALLPIHRTVATAAGPVALDMDESG